MKYDETLNPGLYTQLVTNYGILDSESQKNGPFWAYPVFSQILSLFSKNGRNSLTVWPNFKFRTILETRTIAGSRKICLI